MGKCTDYTSVDEMCADFAQMFENACTYNEPSSTLYKDALSMQRALFLKRDEMSRGSEENAPPPRWVANCVQEIVEQLFASCMQYEDGEGRVYADTLLQLYAMLESDWTSDDRRGDKLDFVVTLEYMRARVTTGVYKRLDVFQNEMFLFFNQIRHWSYIEGKPLGSDALASSPIEVILDF